MGQAGDYTSVKSFQILFHLLSGIGLVGKVVHENGECELPACWAGETPREAGIREVSEMKPRIQRCSLITARNRDTRFAVDPHPGIVTGIRLRGFPLCPVMGILCWHRVDGV